MSIANIESEKMIIRKLTTNDECERLFNLVDAKYSPYSRDYELELLEQISELLRSGVKSESITSTQIIPALCALNRVESLTRYNELSKALKELNAGLRWATPFRQVINAGEWIVKKLAKAL